jgi:hypothetical protein
MMGDPVTFDFSVKEAVQEGAPEDVPVPSEWIDWDYDGKTLRPKLGVDRDGIPVVLWLPQFLADAGHASTPPLFTCYTIFNFSTRKK